MLGMKGKVVYEGGGGGGGGRRGRVRGRGPLRSPFVLGLCTGKKKGRGSQNLLSRPIICVCNDQ